MGKPLTEPETMMQEALKNAKHASNLGDTRRRKYEILKIIRDQLNEEMSRVVDDMADDLESR